MKVLSVSYNPIITNNKRPVFHGSKLGFAHIYDIFTPNKAGLTKIEGIKAGAKGGTTCNGSLPLLNFWKHTDATKKKMLKKIGMSTNSDGYARCFLKSKSNIPISTSFVHNCTVMYLHNNKTNTHCLYHAEEEANKSLMEYITDVLMPEGFTSGGIIPGCSEWVNSHIENMLNMFDLMKAKNPKAVVNVYHSCSTAPEIVGYNGKVYEIPNKEILLQRKLGSEYIRDYGQASFNIVNAQNYDTISKILYECNTLQECERVKNYFKKKTHFPKDIKECFYNAIEKRLIYINMIDKADSLEMFEKLESTLPKFEYFQKAINIKKEQILINKVKNISTKEEFFDICEKFALYNNIYNMKNLKKVILDLEDKFLT